jgi:hypothetical protein
MDDAGYIQKYAPPALTTESGLENLFINIEPDEAGLPIASPGALGVAVAYQAWTEDSWIRNTVFQGFVTPVTLNRTVSRITMSSNSIRRRSESNGSNGYGFDYNISGQQILITKSETLNYNNSYAFAATTQAVVTGPNVVLYHSTVGDSLSQPHQRWATGYLLDDSTVWSSGLLNRYV